MERKLERSSRRDDWAERLEAAAREGVCHGRLSNSPKETLVVILAAGS